MTIQAFEDTQTPALGAPAVVPTVAPAVAASTFPFIPVAIGISAAFIAWRVIAQRNLAQQSPRTPHDAFSIGESLWRVGHKIWLAMATPPVAQAYSVVPYDKAEALAVAYATELGQYVHQTSMDALVEGFTSQINAGVGEGLAWTRAVEGYGLDSRQMRSYVTGLLKAEPPAYGLPPITPAVQSALDKAVLVRADRLGLNESHKAIQVGKSMIWLGMAAAGDLPEGTKKKWVTADDERVCPVCGPLDQVTISLHRRFTTEDGQKFYAPGVHPNCRCTLELVYPERQFDDVVKNMPDDPYDRNEDGEFARMETRHQEQEVRPILNPIQRVRLNPMVAPTPRTEARLQPLRRLHPVKRFSLAPLTRQEAHVAQEIQEELEAAVEDEVKHSGWNYSTIAFVPGTAKGIREQTSTVQWDDINRQLANPSTQRALIGKTVLFTSGYTGFISRHRSAMDDRAFEMAYKREAFEAALAANQRNAQQNIPRGGYSDASKIAPHLNDPYDVKLKDALGGLTSEQLVTIIDETLETARSQQTIDLIVPDRTRKWTNEQIHDYYESKDPNTIATAILMAYAKEESIIQNEFETEWEWTLSDVFTTHLKGPQAKAEAWRAGQTPRAGNIAVLYRMGNGWHGSEGSMGVGVVNNSYKISNVTTVNPPKHIQAQGGDLIEHLVVIDLVPHMDDPLDEQNDFFVQTWND